MPSNLTLNVVGLEQLRLALLSLPPQLVDESTAIVEAQAIEAARLVEGAYPTGPTGNLKAGVITTIGTDPSYVMARVKSTAPHAWWFEYGTQERAWTGKHQRRRKTPVIGKETGRMPARHLFVDIAKRRRQVMTEALIRLVERAGFTVTRT